MVDINGLKIDLCKDTYIPSDDTFLLYDSIEINDIGNPSLEMGCGVGLITLKLASRKVRVVSIDINFHAAKCTYKNAVKNRLDVYIDIICCNMFDALRKDFKFKLIVFNPPYLPHNGEKIDEYSRAYIGGIKGYEVTKTFLKNVKQYLDEDGIIYLLQSSISDIVRNKPINVKKMFFEELRIYRISMFQLDKLI